MKSLEQIGMKNTNGLYQSEFGSIASKNIFYYFPNFKFY